MPEQYNPQDPSQQMARQQAPRMDSFFQISSDIKALNASILVITQKIKYIVRNEKILGRNLIILNKKIKDLRDQGVSGVSGAAGEGSPSSDLLSQIESLQEEISSLKEDLQSLKKISGMLELFNPLEYVRLSQLKEIVSDMVEEELKKRK